MDKVGEKLLNQRTVSGLSMGAETDRLSQGEGLGGLRIRDTEDASIEKVRPPRQVKQPGPSTGKAQEIQRIFH